MADLAWLRAQDARWRAELPALLQTMPGKWVCYRDGVQHVGDTQDEVYGWAMENFGARGGFLIVRVEPERVIDLRRWPAAMVGASVATEAHRAELDALRARAERAEADRDQVMADYQDLACREIPRLTAEVARLRAWMLAYGEHQGACRDSPRDAPCTCGLAALRAPAVTGGGP